MEREQIGALIEERFSFDDILDDALGRLEEKQADIFLRRIAGLGKTLSELETSLVSMLKVCDREETP
jgi:hypothetical protein